MGKKDTITKDYMRDPVVFADAFNQFLYHGRQVIKPENLVERDTAEMILPYESLSQTEPGASVPEQKYQDEMKLLMTDGSVAYCILGEENQSGIHYAMPVKNLAYDSMQLTRQVSDAARSHKKEKAAKPTAEEYLSGFYKTDRLLLVITLTIYWGSEVWDAPLTLKEMYADVDEEILQYAPDYRVNLIAPGTMSEEEIRQFQSSLQEVMLYLKYAAEKEKLYQLTQEEPAFRHVDRQSAEVINVMTNSNLQYPEGEEAVDMCMAIQQMREESKAQGEMKGTIQTCQEFGISFQETISRIATKFLLPSEKAEEEVKKYWQ